MPRVPTATAQPAAAAAVLLRRLGFAILMLVLPVAALFARRAVVVLAPIGIALFVLAAFLDGGARSPRTAARRLLVSAGALAGALMLGWCALSLVWTPFRVEASERLFNIVGTLGLAVAGYLALPDRVRASNLYILPVGVGAAAIAASAAALLRAPAGLMDEASGQTLARGLVVLVLFAWPALAWLRSRQRNLEALLLAVGVALAVALATFPLPLGGLAAGACVFALTAAQPRLGVHLTAAALSATLALAPVLPFLLRPVAVAAFGAEDQSVASLDVWRTIVVDEPVRLITGHGFETALRGRLVGLLPDEAPRTLPFEVWYELGLVGAAAGALAIFVSVRGAGRDHPPLVPGVMASFASAYALACLGIGTAQMWWFTTLAVTILIFVAAQRGQFRTTRPKAVLHARAAV